MHFKPSVCAALATSLIVLAGGCSSGSGSSSGNRGAFKVNLISTGQGQIFPYRIRLIDSKGVPTDNIVNIESEETLRLHASSSNGVLPVASFPPTAVLPDGSPGNHFLSIRFSHILDVESILSNLLANQNSNSGLTTAVNLIAYNPVTETTTVLRGRGFVGGITYYNQSGVLTRVRAVGLDGNGNVQVLDPRATGFPAGFNGADALVSPRTFVFVADTDDNLATFETFPAAASSLIRVVVSNAVRNSDSQVLEQEVRTATTVGTDPNPADVLGFSPSKMLEIIPGNNDAQIDPTTTVLVRFNKPVQPTDVGTFFSRTNLTPATGGVALRVSAAAATFNVAYYADPVSFADLTTYRLTPAYALPGNAQVQVTVNRQSIRNLAGSVLGTDVQTNFATGRGQGIVNAPVAPDAVYVGIGGSEPGVAVIDVNGYGQGTNGLMPNPETGEPTQDAASTNFARNPNIGQPGVSPSLAVGQSPLDAGSNGRLTLVQDTSGNRRLIGAPLVGEITDIHVGCPLDLVFNNSNINANASGANQVNPGTAVQAPGNNITIAPHPNPPRLRFPPPNLSRAIFGEEPTVTSSSGPVGAVVTGGTANGCLNNAVNLLTSASRSDYQPRFLEGVFYGPQPAPQSPPPPPRFCPFTSRQQIGHFLYLLDSSNDQIVVVNSNRFTVLDTIRLPDPTDIAFSPSLALMAVSSFASSTVTFISTDPRSPQFHSIVAQTRVTEGSTSIVWQPDGEAILTVSADENTLTIISATDFSVVREVSGNLNAPFDLAVTERYVTTGNTSGLYYAYILNGDGTVAVYESGPDGVNGIGFNDIVGTVGTTFRRALSVKFDYSDTGLGGAFVAHVDESGVGQLSKLSLTGSPTGQQQTTQVGGNGFVLPPTFRQKSWSVTQTFGGSDPKLNRDVLSGNAPVDVAFDNSFNNAYLANQLTNFNARLGASILTHSSKGSTFTGGVIAYVPKYMFIALRDVGKIDVFEVASRQRVKTIDLPGVRSLADYWRQ